MSQPKFKESQYIDKEVCINALLATQAIRRLQPEDKWNIINTVKQQKAIDLVPRLECEAWKLQALSKRQ